MDNEHERLLAVSAGKLHVDSDYEELLVDSEYGKLLVVSVGLEICQSCFG